MNAPISAPVCMPAGVSLHFVGPNPNGRCPWREIAPFALFSVETNPLFLKTNDLT